MPDANTRGAHYGLALAFTILLPLLSASAAEPELLAREGKGALYEYDGRLVAVLAGTPEEMGRQHGAMLGEEAAILIRRGLALLQPEGLFNWRKLVTPNFAAARARCEPFIPEDCLREMDALADSAGLARDEVRLANLLPELFHCASFAVTGKATAGGELLHGRVLDFKRMELLGLYEHSVVFICLPEGKRPFVSIGYTGFTGVVTGMNASAISVGAMGGGHRGDWDGMPMSFLVRHILEEADSLPDVVRMVEESPRTCEYHFVFADGNTGDAMGLRYTSETVETTAMGEKHPRLPDPLPDVVAVSNPSRLRPLMKRIRARYGAVTPADVRAMMGRPVSKKMNLHCVLFLPERLSFQFAHAVGARHTERFQACHQPYTTIDLAHWLDETRRALKKNRRLE